MITINPGSGGAGGGAVTDASNLTVATAGSTTSGTVKARFGGLHIDVVNDYGCDPTGAADCSAKLQSIFDGLFTNNKSAHVFFPVGRYLCAAPVKVRCQQGTTVVIRGAVADQTPGGAVLVGGAASYQASVLELSGGSEIRVESLSIDGGGKAQFGIYAHRDATSTVGVSSLRLQDIEIGGVLGGTSAQLPAGGKSAMVSLGVFPSGALDNYQCDNVNLTRVNVSGGGSGTPGDATPPHHGIITGTSNAKNFYIYDCAMVGVQRGIHYSGSGTCLVSGGAFANNTISDLSWVGNGEFTIDALDSEGSAKLVDTTGGATAAGTLILRGVEWDGTTALDNVVAKVGAYTRLEGCVLRNGASNTQYPIIQANPGIANFSLTVEGCGLMKAMSDWTDGAGHAILQDTSGNSLFSATYPHWPANVRTFGNYVMDSTGAVTARAEDRGLVTVKQDGTAALNLPLTGMIGATLVASTTVTIPNAANNQVQAAMLTTNNGPMAVWVDVLIDVAGWAQAVSYLVLGAYNATGGAWQVVPPLLSTGPYSGNDFELQAQQGGGALTLRLNRLSGSTTAATATVGIRATAAGTDPIALTTPHTTSTDAAITAMFGSAFLHRSTAKQGFFGVAAAGQQTGGAATAGASYTATEQTMLNAVYGALRTFGFLS